MITLFRSRGHKTRTYRSHGQQDGARASDEHHGIIPKYGQEGETEFRVKDLIQSVRIKHRFRCEDVASRGLHFGSHFKPKSVGQVLPKH